MINWIKNIIRKLTGENQPVNYVVAEYRGSKRKKKVIADPLVEDLEGIKNSTGEYMQIDRLHQKN